MKYVMVFLIVCVALAAAAPQLIVPGWGISGIPRTASTVVGPTVINGLTGTYTYPGVVSTGFI